MYDMIHRVVSFVISLKGGERIKLAQVRRDKGLSQEQLATLSGVHRVTIARFETGKANPNLQTLERLSAALGVPIDDLVDRVGESA